MQMNELFISTAKDKTYNFKTTLDMVIYNSISNDNIWK